MQITENAVAGFRLNLAARLNMFWNREAGDLAGELSFLSEKGFYAVEDPDFMARDENDRKLLTRELIKAQMRMGAFLAYADLSNPTFVKSDDNIRRFLTAHFKRVTAVAQEANAKWVIVIPGAVHPRMEPAYQMANCIDNLRRCTEICESAGIIMLIKPVNKIIDYPAIFMSRIAEAYEICRAVNSPSCKILDNLYHQQISEGNLIDNLIKAWGEIAYIQAADHPGRGLPGSGEINFKNIFRFLHQKGYPGVIGLDHRKGQGPASGAEADMGAWQEAMQF